MIVPINPRTGMVSSQKIKSSDRFSSKSVISASVFRYILIGRNRINMAMKNSINMMSCIGPLNTMIQFFVEATSSLVKLKINLLINSFVCLYSISEARELDVIDWDELFRQSILCKQSFDNILIGKTSRSNKRIKVT